MHALISIIIISLFALECFKLCVLFCLQFPAWLGLLIACGWCFSVCASRIYLGVHSILVSQ